MAVTDHGNMFGAIDFYKKAKDAGIKPILGLEAYVAGPKGRERPDGEGRQPPHPPGQERGGLRQPPLPLLQGVPRRLLLPPAHRQAGAQGAQQGPLRRSPRAWAARSPRPASAATWTTPARAALEYKDIFEPGHFFLEIQSNGMPEQEKANDEPQAALARRRHPAGRHRGRALHQARGRRGARAPDVHRQRQDARRQQAHAALAPTSSTSRAPRRCWRTSRTSPEAVAQHACASPSSATWSSKLGKPMLPTFKVPGRPHAGQFMAELATQGPRASASRSCRYPVDRDAYLHARSELELGVISARWGSPATSSSSRTSSTGRSSTASRWARAAARAPARIVAYALRITDLDPIPYNLLFERFLNPERVSMPDFDIDFCQDRRDEVIQYVGRQVRREQRRADHHLRLAQGEERAPRRVPRVRPAVLAKATASPSWSPRCSTSP